MDIVLNHALKETAYDKKQYLVHIKDYMKAWVSVQMGVPQESDAKILNIGNMDECIAIDSFIRDVQFA